MHREVIVTPTKVTPKITTPAMTKRIDWRWIEHEGLTVRLNIPFNDVAGLNSVRDLFETMNLSFPRELQRFESEQEKNPTTPILIWLGAGFFSALMLKDILASI